MLDWVFAAFNLSTAIYWLPLIGLFVTAGLYVFGIEIDALGYMDDTDAGWKRLLFPRPDLRGLSVALFISAWSAAGLTLNSAAGQGSALPVYLLIFAVSLILGCAASYGGTILIDLIFPSEAKRPTRAELIGETATILDPPVTGDLGRARVQLPGGSITIFCKNIGDGDFPDTGSVVMIAAYDEETNTFDVF